MRNGVAALVLVLSALAAAEEATGPVVADFDKDNVGNAPEGFSFGRTGQGPDGSWIVQAAEGAPSGANVLAQTSTDDTDRRFPVAVWAGGSWKDLAVAVKFRPVSGEADQAGGVVLRYTDADNYYVARANAIEGNCRFYFVKDGERRQLGTADVAIEAGKWHARGSGTRPRSRRRGATSRCGSTGRSCSSSTTRRSPGRATRGCGRSRTPSRSSTT